MNEDAYNRVAVTTRTIPAEAVPFEQSARDVLEHAPCGFLSTLLDGTITQVNATLVSWIGQSRATLVGGKRFQDLLTLPGRVFYETHVAPLLRMQGFVKEIACQLNCVGREPLEVLVNSKLILAANGEPLGIQIIVFDATDRAKYERELRRARNEAQQLAAIVTASNDAIVCNDLDGLVSAWNPGATSLFGYSEAEAIGRPVDELIVPVERRAEREAMFEDVRAGRKAILKETVRRHRNGHLVPVEINASPMFDSDGVVTAISFIFRDITQRLRDQQALRESEKELADFFDNASVGLHLVGPDGIILKVNQTELNLLGYSQEEYVGHHISKFHADPSVIDNILQRLRRGETIKDYDAPLRCKNGEIRHVAISSNALFRDGEFVHTRCFTRDVTDRRLAQAALRESEEFNRSIIESSPDCLKVLNLDGKLEHMNVNGCKLMEVDDFSILAGMEWHELWPTEYRAQILNSLAAARVGQSSHFEAYCPTFKGNPKWWDVVVNPAGGAHGHCHRIIASSRDITQRKRVEIQLQQSASKLRLGLQIAGTGLGAMDYLTGTIVLDDTAAAIFSLPANRPLPRSDVHARFHPEDAPNIRAKIADVLGPLSDGFFALEHRVSKPDGSIAWVSAHKQVEFSTAPDGSKSAVSGLLAVLDITDRRHAETELREREERLRLVLDGSLSFIGVMETDGTLLEANAPALAAGGLTREDVIGRKVWDTYWFSHDEVEIDRLKDAVARARNGEVVRHDALVRTIGDTRMTIDFMLAPVRDAQGRVRLLVPSGFDITERKRAERELAQSEILFRATFENAAVGLSHVGVDGKWLRVNQRLCQITGYTVDELLALKFQDITHPEDLDVDLAYVQRMLAGEIDNYAMEKRYVRKDRSAVWVNLTVGCVRHCDGAIDYFIAAVEDISDRKEAEAHNLLLMAEVNHRAKNLLSVVQAIASQTARTGDPATFAMRLSERIRGLAACQDLLVKNHWQGVSVSDLVHAQLDHFRDIVGTRVLIEGPSVELTAAAAQAIGMALHELGTNAVKYGSLSTGEGRVLINWNVGSAREPTFTMQWREEGGPKVSSPGRPGFGKMVVGRMVEAAVEGAVEIDYRTSGLSWTLIAPTKSTLEGAQDA